MPRGAPTPIRLRLLALAVALAGLLAGAAPAAAQSPSATRPASLDRPEPGFRITPRAALRTADRLRAVRTERARSPALRSRVIVPSYFGDRRYEIVYMRGAKVIVDVHVGDRTGRVLEVWTGPQADTLLARGYEPSLGRALNRPYVWLPLAALFLVPFFDFRRPRRLLHLDLLVILAFGVSQLYFNRGDIEVSVPLTVPPLAYAFVRLLLAGLRPRPRAGPLVPHLPIAALAVGLVLLVAVRLALGAVDANVIDVGQESVFGADRIQHSESLYNADGDHGDTYGPITYLAYVPFEAIWPADGAGGFNHAARAAAITFDLLVILGLLALGARLRPGRSGRELGVCLAYAWAACPFSLYALHESTNDALVAALVVAVLLAVRRPALRGLALGVAAAAKFAPLVLAPLLSIGTEGRSWRERLTFGLAVVAVTAVAVVAYLPDGGLAELWDTTLGYQLGRESPFSIWGLNPSLGWLQDALKAGLGGLALALAFVPRERDLRQVTALCGALLVGTQLIADYWLYFYLVWFLPLFLAASLTSVSPTTARTSAGSSPSVSARRAAETTPSVCGGPGTAR